MSTVTFEESGMQFGPFENKDVFAAEKFSQKKHLVSKSVEFVLFRGKKAIFLEAKSSIPQSSDDINKKFLPSIAEKLSDTLHLVASDYMKILSERDSLLDPLKGRNWEQLSINYYVVLKGMPKDQLPALHDMFNAYPLLNKLKKIWSPNKSGWVKVINDVKARDMGLIASGND